MSRDCADAAQADAVARAELAAWADGRTADEIRRALKLLAVAFDG